MKAIATLLPAVILSALPVQGAPDDEGGLFETLAAHTRGGLHIRSDWYLHEPSQGDLRPQSVEDARFTATSRLEWATWYRTKGGPRLDAAGWFEYGTPHRHRWKGGFAPWRDEAARSRPVVLEELALRVPLQRMDLIVGKTHIRNSIAPLFSPADRYTPEDYNDPLEAKELGVWQARMDYQRERWRYSLAALPVFQPDKFPGERSRWFLNEAESVIGASIPSGVALDFDRKVPAQSLENIGVLGSVRTRQTGWDAFASIHHGIAPYPVFAVSPASTPGTVRVESGYVEGFDAAAGLSTVAGHFEFHGEAVYHHAEERRDDSYVQGLAGLTWRPAQLPAHLGCNQIVITLDYSREWITRDQDSPDFQISSRAFRFGRDTLIAEALFEVTRRDDLKLRYVRDFEGAGNSLTRLEAGHRFDSGVRIELAGAFFSGEGLYFGDWERNDRISLSAEYSF